jgi:hypothetical protein
MTLFLVQHGEAKLAIENPSDPRGKCRTRLLDSEIEFPVIDHERFCEDTRTSSTFRHGVRQRVCGRCSVPGYAHSPTRDRLGCARSTSNGMIREADDFVGLLAIRQLGGEAIEKKDLRGDEGSQSPPGVIAPTTLTPRGGQTWKQAFS